MHFLTGRYFKVNEDKAKFEYLRAKQGPSISSGYSLTVEQSRLHVFFNFPVESETYVRYLRYLTLVSRTQSLSDRYCCARLGFPPFTQHGLLHSAKSTYFLTSSSNESLVLVVGQW